MSRIQELFEAGAHFGYSKTRRHPTTAPFIFGTKNRVDIIDLEKSLPQLEKAEAYIKELKAAGKFALWVGVKPEAQAVTIATASTLGMPYVNERWVGGTITNFSEIKKRIARLEDLKKEKAEGSLEKKYTKKERLLIDREIEKMEKNFAGMIGMQKIPDALIIIDPRREHIAVTEARKMNIPIIALCNTDCNIDEIDYPVVGNDGARNSITYFVRSLQTAYNA